MTAINWKHRFFLARGWARYLAKHSRDAGLMERVLRERGKEIKRDGSWAVLVSDDYWALCYQRLNFRLRRANRAVQKDVPRQYSFSGNGPLTLNLMGATIPGWEPDPDEIAIPREAKQFDENYRQKAVRAKRLLADQEPMQTRLNRIDENEALREAMGG